MTRQVFLDVETTGLSPQLGDRIVEIACVEAYNNQATGQVFHHYCNPERSVSTSALGIHGLSNAFLQMHSPFATIAADLLAFVSGAEIIIHNARFDIGFLNAEFHRIKAGVMTDYAGFITDSLHIARQRYPRQRNDLDAICKRFGILDTSRTQHSALQDAQLLAAVYAQLNPRPSNTLT